jgi:hypothetical protein
VQVTFQGEQGDKDVGPLLRQEVHGVKDIKYVEAKREILLVKALKNPLSIDTSGMLGHTVGQYHSPV